MKLTKVECREGVYTWRAEVNDDMRRFRSIHAMRMLWIISGVLLLIGLYLVSMDPMALTYLILSFAIMIPCVLLGAVISLRSRMAEFLPYEMTEDHIRFGSGKESFFIEFKSVKAVEEGEESLFLTTRFTRYPIHIPQEDREEITDFILRRIEEKTRLSAR